jgi:hypothetical protein
MHHQISHQICVYPLDGNARRQGRDLEFLRAGGVGDQVGDRMHMQLFQWSDPIIETRRLKMAKYLKPIGYVLLVFVEIL